MEKQNESKRQSHKAFITNKNSHLSVDSVYFSVTEEQNINYVSRCNIKESIISKIKQLYLQSLLAV